MNDGARAIVIGLLAACAVAGFFAAYAIAAAADSGTPQGQPTTEPPTTEPPPTETTVPPREPSIPLGVKIGHVDVGGLLPYEAAAEVRDAFARPIVLVAKPRRFTVTADDVGARANIRKAVSRARWSRPGTSVPLHVWVSRERVRGYVESLAGELDKAPVSSRIVLRGATIRASRSVDGRRLQRIPSARAIRVSLKTNLRKPITLAFSPVRPKIGEENVGPAVVILRETKRLRLYEGAKLVRTFGIATGQAAYPTPIGSFEVVTKQRNPWWYPPPSGWAADADPVPPGPGNPLGTRWMGISAPYVGIHGTPDSASIGYSASHGCVRMRIPDAEWLFQRVEVGTPVFIVRQ